MFTLFQKTSKAFIMLSAIYTLAPISIAINPKAGLANIFNIQFIEEYGIFIQHWGMLIATIGVFLFLSAFKLTWRVPVLLIAAIGKTGFFLSYIFNALQPFAVGFKQAAFIDLVIAVYFFMYLFHHKKLLNPQEEV